METVIRDVEPLFTILYEALEAGTLRAAEFFADEDRPVDKTLFPHLVRYYAGLVLREKSEAIGELQVEEVPNNGLSLVWHRYRIRIWKSTDGELPYPGNSQVKQAFLRQQHFVFDTPVQEPVVEINLAVLWEVDFNYRLTRFPYSADPNIWIQDMAEKFFRAWAIGSRNFVGNRELPVNPIVWGVGCVPLPPPTPTTSAALRPQA